MQRVEIAVRQRQTFRTKCACRRPPRREHHSKNGRVHLHRQRQKRRRSLIRRSESVMVQLTSIVRLDTGDEAAATLPSTPPRPRERRFHPDRRSDAPLDPRRNTGAPLNRASPSESLRYNDVVHHSESSCLNAASTERITKRIERRDLQRAHRNREVIIDHATGRQRVGSSQAEIPIPPGGPLEPQRKGGAMYHPTGILNA